MLLRGSCHCGAVAFQVDSPHPYPYNICYCSICRKTAGGGGYAINLSGVFNTLKVSGREHTSVYNAIIDGEKSPAERHFCKDKHYPEFPDESIAQWHDALNLTQV